jgi:biopolymer transport protein ExbB
MDIKNLFTAGSVVMWPLLLSSVLAVWLIVERIKFWVTISTRQQLVFRNVLNLYRKNNIDTLRKNPDISAGVLLKP